MPNNIFEQAELLKKVEEIKTDVMKRSKTNIFSIKKSIIKGITVASLIFTLISGPGFGASYSVANVNELISSLRQDLIATDKETFIDYNGTEMFSTVAEMNEWVLEVLTTTKLNLPAPHSYNQFGSSYTYSYLTNPNGKYSINDVTFNDNFKHLKTELDEINDRVTEILADIISPEMSDGQKVYAVYSYVIDTLRYQFQQTDGNLDGLLKERNVLGALRDGTGVVCDAYAFLTSMMLTQLGYENYFTGGNIVNADGSKGTGHAWNLVKVDGNWHHIDATWGDFDIESQTAQALANNPTLTEDYVREYLEPYIESEKQKYFLVSDEVMSQSRTWDKTVYPAAPTSYVAPEGEDLEENPYELSVEDLAREVQIRELINSIDQIMLKGESEITQNDIDSIRTLVSEIDAILEEVENLELKGDLETDVTAAEIIADNYQTIVTADTNLKLQIDSLYDLIGEFGLKDPTAIVQTDVDTMRHYLSEISELIPTIRNTDLRTEYESSFVYLNDFVDAMQDTATQNLGNQGNQLSENDVNLIAQITALVNEFDSVVSQHTDEPTQENVYRVTQIVDEIDLLIALFEDETSKSNYETVNNNNRNAISILQQMVDELADNQLSENDIILIDQINTLISEHDEILLQHLVEPKQEHVDRITQIVDELDLLITQLADETTKSEYATLNENHRNGILAWQQMVDEFEGNQLSENDINLIAQITTLVNEFDNVVSQHTDEPAQENVDRVTQIVDELDVLIAQLENEATKSDYATVNENNRNAISILQQMVDELIDNQLSENDINLIGQITSLISELDNIALQHINEPKQENVERITQIVDELDLLIAQLEDETTKSEYVTVNENNRNAISFLQQVVDEFESNQLSENDINLISQINTLISEHDDIISQLVDEPTQENVDKIAQIVDELDLLIAKLEDTTTKSDYMTVNEYNRNGISFWQQQVDELEGNQLSENDINLTGQITTLISELDNIVFQHIDEPKQENVDRINHIVNEIDVLIAQLEDETTKSDYVTVNGNNRNAISFLQQMVDELEESEDPEESEAPEVPATPEVPVTPPTTSIPDFPSTPQVPSTSQVPSTGDVVKVPVLPEKPKTSEEIERDKKASYVKVDEFKTIINKTGDDSSFVLVNGKAVYPDVKPLIFEPVKRIAYVPIRFICEALGFNVRWIPGYNGQAGRVYLQKDGNGILLNIGSNVAYVKGKGIEMNSATFIENNRTYVSVEAIIELLKANIDYIDAGSLSYLNILEY